MITRAVASACIAASFMASASVANVGVAIPGYTLVHTEPVDLDLPATGLADPVSIWCRMIDQTQREIDFEEFYVSGQPSEPLDRILRHLDAAARRGVKIRFLMEAKGLSDSNPATIARLKAIPGLQFRMLDWARVSGEGIIHAKFFVIDGGRSGYLGSQNFDWRSLKEIDETGVEITDRVVGHQLKAIFDEDWYVQALVAAGRRVPSINAASPAASHGNNYLVASPTAFDPPGVRDSQAELVHLIGLAKHDIAIEVMDYAPIDFEGRPYPIIDDAIRAAAARGVHVRLLVADWSLTPERLPYLKSLARVPNVAIRVVTLPQAKAGFIPYARVVHTKDMAIDGQVAWIGTSNWEGGYLDTSRNVEMVLRSPVMANEVAALQDRLWRSAYAKPFDPQSSYPPPHPGHE